MAMHLEIIPVILRCAQDDRYDLQMSIFFQGCSTVAEWVCYNETSLVTQKVFSVISNFCIIMINGEHSAGIRDMILASIGTR